MNTARPSNDATAGVNTPERLVDLCVLMAVASVLRAHVFSGSILPDDSVYVALVDEIRNGAWPIFSARSPWPGRPGLLLVVWASLSALGWNDVGLVAPFFAASLVIVALTYSLGTRLFGRLEGVVAGLAFALFPLDAVLASTLANDILVSALIVVAATALVRAGQRQERTALAWAAAAGLSAGLAVTVKSNALAFGALLGLGYAYGVRRRLRAGTWKTVAAYALPFLAVQFAIAAWVWWLTGSPLTHIVVERDYYRLSEWVTQHRDVWRELGRYPAWMLGLGVENYYSVLVRPYGLFFVPAFLLIPWALWKHRAVRMVALAALAVFAVMEFTPLQIAPYVPIHRIPRALHLMAVPVSLIYGRAFFAAVQKGRSASSFVSVVALTLFAATGLFYILSTGDFFSDTGRDRAWAFDKLRDEHPARVVTDDEMAQYLTFRFAMHPPYPIVGSEKPPDRLEPGDVYVYGGSRRPEYHVIDPSGWAELARTAGCRPIAETTYPIRPWREIQTSICRVD